MIGTRVILTGKEANQIEEVESGAVTSWDEVRETYDDPSRDPFTGYVVPILKRISCAELMARTGCRERHIKSIRNGYRNPSVHLKNALTEIAAAYARRFMPEPAADDLDACAALFKIGPQ